MSHHTSGATIAHTVGYWSQDVHYHLYDANQSDPANAYYELMRSSWSNPNEHNGISFHSVSLGTELRVNHNTSDANQDNDDVPDYFTITPSGGSAGSNQTSALISAGDTVNFYRSSNNFHEGGFVITAAMIFASSGPSVTSITEDTVYVPTDTVVASDFTLVKNTSSYATSNISLTGPTTMTNTGGRGYLYDLVSNVSHDNGVYDFTIDSKHFAKFRYDDSWTSNPTSGRSTNSTRILNVLAKIPNTTALTATGPTLPSNNGSEQLFEVLRQNRFIEYAIGTSYNGTYADAPSERVAFVVGQYNNQIQGYFYYYNYADVSGTYIESAKTEIGSQATHSWAVPATLNSGSFGALVLSVTDWVYSAEPEGDGYNPAVTAKGNSRNFW